MTNRALEESEEIILSKYFDDECTANERVKAEQLLRTSKEASQFLNDMRAINDRVKSQESIQPSKIDQQRFWSKISARIEQEERLSVLVGERAETKLDNQVNSAIRVSSNWYSNLSTWFKESFVIGGLSGAVVTAALLLFLAPYGSSPHSVTGTPGQSASNFNTGAAVSPVNFSAGLNSTSHMNSARSYNVFASRNPIEVDWMRGNGRVTIIQGSPANSPIIWVKRKNNTNNRLSDPLTQGNNTFMSR